MKIHMACNEGQFDSESMFLASIQWLKIPMDELTTQGRNVFSINSMSQDTNEWTPLGFAALLLYTLE